MIFAVFDVSDVCACRR